MSHVTHLILRYKDGAAFDVMVSRFTHMNESRHTYE